MKFAAEIYIFYGPKRDRRLWIGDLRMQALANYETFKNYDLVKRCLYLFAGSTLENGRVGACLFTEPETEVDDTVMFDYSLFFLPTLLDYYKATGDRKTMEELAPTGFRQIELVQSYFDEDQLVKDSDVLGWCFVDWNLNKQASAQGSYLYCMKSAMEIAEILGQQERLEIYRDDYCSKQAAAEKLWNGEFYVSGENKQISWASQVWMTLGGSNHGGADLWQDWKILLRRRWLPLICTTIMWMPSLVREKRRRHSKCFAPTGAAC